MRCNTLPIQAGDDPAIDNQNIIETTRAFLTVRLVLEPARLPSKAFTDQQDRRHRFMPAFNRTRLAALENDLAQTIAAFA